MPYYDSLGRYINPFYLDVHPDVRTELEARAGYVASDFRSSNTKSIEWPYQKMPWAYVASIDYPNVRIGFEKEKFAAENSDKDGNLLLYGKQRNQPKFPLLTGVELSNMGQRGALLKGKFSFTYFPELTLQGFELEDIQGALFTPGREVQISFGWSVYAENPWVNKLEFKGLIYGFNWSFQPNLSITADVEVVSATTIALGWSGDQTIIASETTDIVTVDGWNSALKGLNLLSVIDTDLTIMSSSISQDGQLHDYWPKSKTTQKLLDYHAICIPTAEYEEIINVVVNDYTDEPTDEPTDETPQDGTDGGDDEKGIVDKIKKASSEYFDEMYKDLGIDYFTDPNSEWNQAKGNERWSIILRKRNYPLYRRLLGDDYNPLQPQKTIGSSDTYEEYVKTIDFGSIEHNGIATKKIQETFTTTLQNDNIQIIERVWFTGTDSDAFTPKLENNTKKKVEEVKPPDGTYPSAVRSSAKTYKIKPNPNIPNYDILDITFKPKRHGAHYAQLNIRLVKYTPDPQRPGFFIDDVKSVVEKMYKITANGLAVTKGEGGEKNETDLNFDNDPRTEKFEIVKLDSNGKPTNQSEVMPNTTPRFFEVGKYYRITLARLFGTSIEDGIYNNFEAARIEIINPKINDITIIGETNLYCFISGRKLLKHFLDDAKTSVFGADNKDAQKYAGVSIDFAPKTEGKHTFRLKATFDSLKIEKDSNEKRTVTETVAKDIQAYIGLNVIVGRDDNLIKEASKKEEEKDKTYDKAKKEFDDTVDKKEKSIEGGPDTENPSDTGQEETPITAENESQIKVTVKPKVYWYVALGSLIEFANAMLETYEDDSKNKNKGFAKRIFRFQAFNNEAEYNKLVRSAYPIDVYFPDSVMGKYGGFQPFCNGIYDKDANPKGNEMLRMFSRVKNKKRQLVLENDVINIGQILIGVDSIRSIYTSFLEEGGKNIALKNITKFFDEILKLISTATGEIYQFTSILFEEPEKLLSRSERDVANARKNARGGSRIELSDLFQYGATDKRSMAIVSIEDTNLAAKVVGKDNGVDPYKFDASVIRPMLRNVQVVSKPSKEMAAAAYIAARGQKSQTGSSPQSLEVTLNLQGYQNKKQYDEALKTAEGDLEKHVASLKDAGWNPTLSEMIRGGLMTVKRTTLIPKDKNGLGTSWLNRAIYPIEFTVTLDGINGFKFGDVVTTSLIPKHYFVDWGIVFTVTKIVHKINVSTWETTLNTVARLDANKSYASKTETPYK